MRFIQLNWLGIVSRFGRELYREIGRDLKRLALRAETQHLYLSFVNYRLFRSFF